MLLWLADLLAKDVRAFNVFGYLTLRAVLSCMTALFISFIVGPRMIAWLSRMKIGQSVRDDGPQTHLTKAGTPTMGGALILVSIAVTTLLWGDLANRFVWVVLLVMLGFGAIGWVDDWRKVVHRNPKGLSARQKIAWQSAIALCAAAYLAFSVSASDNAQVQKLFVHGSAAASMSTCRRGPTSSSRSSRRSRYPLGIWGFIALTYFVIVGTSNAVNLTDGLDGLAIMPTVMIGAALGIFAYVSGNAIFARYLQFPLIPGAGELAVICGAVAGAGLGFLWFNAYPAEVFMGDVGALVARRRARHDRRHRSPGNRSLHHGRGVRRRDAVGGDPGRVVQADWPPRLPDGADPPSLRIEGVEREPGRGAILDRHDVARPVRPVDTEAALMDYSGRNAIVLGLGLTGFSLARHLAANGARVRVADTRPAPPFADRLRRELPDVPLATGAIADSTLAGADLIAISPGIAKDQPAIAAAIARGAELVGDIELFARALPAGQKVLAITGSNGKTTVTALTGALARAAGLATVGAGNIGNAVLDAIPAAQQRWPDIFVLELSSFQLETTSSLSPTAATVLNVSENHLDRYAGLEHYAAAKARIFAGGGTQVLNRDDARSLAMRLPGRLVQTFGGGVPESEEAWGIVERARDAGGAWLARGGALLLPVVGSAPRGPPQRAERARRAGARVDGREDRPLGARRRSPRFEGLPHRMQRIAEADGVVYVDDSKGTTVAATRAALEGIGRPVVLIAGGDGKGQDFGALRDAGRRALSRGAADRPRRVDARARARRTPGPRRALRDAGDRRRACGGARAAGRRGVAVAGVREPRPVRELRRARRALRESRAHRRSAERAHA